MRNLVADRYRFGVEAALLVGRFALQDCLADEGVVLADGVEEAQVARCGDEAVHRIHEQSEQVVDCTRESDGVGVGVGQRKGERRSHMNRMARASQ